jgi:hypothetical protein
MCGTVLVQGAPQGVTKGGVCVCVSTHVRLGIHCKGRHRPQMVCTAGSYPTYSILSARSACLLCALQHKQQRPTSQCSLQVAPTPPLLNHTPSSVLPPTFHQGHACTNMADWHQVVCLLAMCIAARAAKADQFSSPYVSPPSEPPTPKHTHTHRHTALSSLPPSTRGMAD